jgi:hypothetical protein
MQNTQSRTNEGIRRLVEQGRKSFRIPENLEFYADKDLKRAEKKFIKLCIIEQRCANINAFT